MGFGGAVAAMITSLKNNKRTRKTVFDKETAKMRSSYGEFIDHKKMSPSEFAEFKKTLLVKRQKERLKNKLLVLITVGIMILLFAVGIYFTS